MASAVLKVAAVQMAPELGAVEINRPQVLAEAGREDDAILHAELDLDKPRQKHMVLEPGVFESDLLADRRPDLYGSLSETALKYGCRNHAGKAPMIDITRCGMWL